MSAYWDEPWSVIKGCSSASEGCENCWARKLDERFGDRKFDTVRVFPERLSMPVHWERPRIVFVCNTSDLFHPSVPFELVAAAYGVMAACPRHVFLVLTKRPERRLEFMRWLAGRMVPKSSGPQQTLACTWEAWRTYGVELPDSLLSAGWEVAGSRKWPLENVWEGVTVENQARADERIPLLVETPAAHRWVSAEPLLGGVDFWQWLNPDDNGYESNGPAGWISDVPIHWIVAGGESGTSCRPTHPAWVRAIRDQCHDAGVPFMFKQWGGWVQIDKPQRENGPRLQDPKERLLELAGHQAVRMLHVGPRAGATLDGRVHTAMPEQLVGIPAGRRRRLPHLDKTEGL
jgi:protein gp37